MAPCRFCILWLVTLWLSGAAAATAAQYHRPLFERFRVDCDGLKFLLEYDKTDPEHLEDRRANTALTATIARVLRQERARLNAHYPLPESPSHGILSQRFDADGHANYLLPISSNISCREAPEDISRLGAETWARQLTSRCLVENMFHHRIRKIGSPIDRFLSRRLIPMWLPLGVSRLASEPWTPEKMALLLAAARSNELIPLERYVYFKSFTVLERIRAAQESQAFCQWLIEHFDKQLFVKLIDAYAQSPTTFSRSFKRLTAMTQYEAQRRFRRDLLRFARREQRWAFQPSELLFSGLGILGKARLSPGGRRIAFTSNHLRPHIPIRDLFVTPLQRSSKPYFAASNVLPSLSWHPTITGFFFIRDIWSRRGKRYQQLCWSRCPDNLDRTPFERGLDFTTLLRGTRFREVACSPDGRYLSLLRQRPGSAELTIYELRKHRRTFTITPTNRLSLDGRDHRWLNDRSIVFIATRRGTSSLRLLDVCTQTERELFHSTSPILDLVTDKDRLLFSSPWAEDRGVIIRELSTKERQPPRTRLIIPEGGFRFSLTPDANHVIHTCTVGTRLGLARTALLDPPSTKTTTKLISEPHATAFELEPPAPYVDMRHEDVTAKRAPLRWPAPSTRLVIDTDTFAVITAVRDELDTRRTEAAWWYDTDFSRGNWQVRFHNQSRYPFWYVGAFDTTTDDFLGLFPLSRFTNAAFFTGGTVGCSFDLTAKESLGIALEFKQNEYRPEFFPVGVEVPSDTSISNNLYRIRYTWDLREPNPASAVAPSGSRLFELSFADSLGWLDSGLRYREFIGDWREYFRVGGGDRNVVAFRLVGGVRNKRRGGVFPVEFEIGGPDTLRGVQENSLRGRRFAAASLEYRTPILQRRTLEQDFGILRDPTFRSLFYFDTVHLALFMDAGQATDHSLSLSKLQKGVGIEFRAQSLLTTLRPLILRFGFAHGLDTLGENTLYLTTSTVF